MSKINERIVLPNGSELQSRLVKAAMTEGLADYNNHPTDELIALYELWAHQNGDSCGCFITGNVQVDRRYLERAGNVCVDRFDRQGDAAYELLKLQQLSAAAKTRGAKCWAQISHAGRQGTDVVSCGPAAPSEVQVDLPMGFGRPRAMTADEIEQVPMRFAFAAAWLAEAGFDGVQVHSAHGYLLAEFLSPLVNRRQDDYGGPLENRARLLLEVVAAVREAVLARFPRFVVAVKLNSSDFQRGGLTSDEAERVVRWLDEAGVDVIEVSGGSYEAPAMMGGLEEDRRADPDGPLLPSTLRREAYFAEFARRARASVARAAVMMTGGVRSGAVAQAAFDAAVCDLVGVARPLCVFPAALYTFVHSPDLRLDVPTARLGPTRYLGPNSPIKPVRGLVNAGSVARLYASLVSMAKSSKPTPLRSGLIHVVSMTYWHLKREEAMARIMAPRILGGSDQGRLHTSSSIFTTSILTFSVLSILGIGIAYFARPFARP